MPSPTLIRPIEKLAFRIDEAVAATGLSRSTLYLLIGSGKLRSMKVGERRLLLREELAAFLTAAQAGDGSAIDDAL
jgi:excisionase family DNA binding protein